ncbi:type IV pilus modification PilV family protein [Vibrio comitans]|uniref:MSHA pilin protein MshD n=1 Tax=Vibrio comitans NBRC 102076 TaxID=1219078 RepID=A0A4Y3ISY5_9VIBR|nr:prepilin-type N-terminal cleavage/methylation domain-containing protein [Vibrio comitans]GEA62337.1 MSHA pilin protein MshD [Vibrio comitans NBRC 102076]
MAVKKVAGFTLIESIIAIVILGLAMITLTSFLYPQIAQSAKPYYEVRASALANSLMTEILSRNFDDLSDHDGGEFRCGEDDYLDTQGNIISCTPSAAFGPDNFEPPELFNDVDDYVGCWYTTNQSKANCRVDEAGNLNDIFGNNISNDYLGFRAEISVNYDYDTRLGVPAEGGGLPREIFKVVTVVITASQYGDFTFVAHRGNY